MPAEELWNLSLADEETDEEVGFHFLAVFLALCFSNIHKTLQHGLTGKTCLFLHFCKSQNTVPIHVNHRVKWTLDITNNFYSFSQKIMIAEADYWLIKAYFWAVLCIICWLRFVVVSSCITLQSWIHLNCSLSVGVQLICPYFNIITAPPLTPSLCFNTW